MTDTKQLFIAVLESQRQVLASFISLLELNEQFTVTSEQIETAISCFETVNKLIEKISYPEKK